MKKSVIIFGKQGSGKSTMITSLVCKLNKSSVKNCIGAYFSYKSLLNLSAKVKTITIDELSDVEMIKMVNEASQHNDFKFIVSTQLEYESVPSDVLSAFEIVRL
jgi:ABC-type phosphate/phosphonate transport system ATPase subunit